MFIKPLRFIDYFCENLLNFGVDPIQNDRMAAILAFYSGDATWGIC